MKIAVIGAGISGLVTANKLAKDFAVTVFEKARGVGGRMSTRSAVDLQFDHGAQHFVAKSAVFQNFLQDLESKKIVARFDADFCEINNYKITHRIKWSKDYPHYVATPKMNSLCKYLAQNLTVKTQTPVKNIFAKNNQWQLFDEENNDLGIFDWVICSAPAKQTIDLMPENFVHLSRVKKTKMLGCFALMLAFDRSLPIDWQMALVKNSKISWISLDSAKPQRSQSLAKPCFVVHSSNAWAEAHMEDDLEKVKAELITEFGKIIGFDANCAIHSDIQRWRYANIPKQVGEKSLIDQKNKLAACGDWLIHGRVESAFLSGFDLASRIKS